MRVDPEFYMLVRLAVNVDPTINQRQVTKNIAKKKCVVGELLFNDDFASEVEQAYERKKANKELLFDPNAVLEELFR